MLPLLAAGLGGSVLSQFIPLSDAVAPWAEALVSLSLAVEGVMALTATPSAWLLPLIGLHGFLLGSTIVGAEPTPLLTYFLGLLVGQGALLLVTTSWSKGLAGAPWFPGTTARCWYLDRHRHGFCLGRPDRLIR